MNHPLVGALLTFLGGAGVAALTAALTKKTYEKNPNAFMRASTVRQLIHIAYLAAVYLLAPHLPWELLPLLIGAALGITLVSTALSFRLARQVRTEGKNTIKSETKGE